MYSKHLTGRVTMRSSGAQLILIGNRGVLAKCKNKVVLIILLIAASSAKYLREHTHKNINTKTQLSTESDWGRNKIREKGAYMAAMNSTWLLQWTSNFIFWRNGNIIVKVSLSQKKQYASSSDAVNYFKKLLTLWRKKASEPSLWLKQCWEDALHSAETYWN